jgi:hypothetical protein
MGQIGLAAGDSSLGWTALYQLCLYNIYRLLGGNKTLYRQLVQHAAWSTGFLRQVRQQQLRQLGETLTEDWCGGNSGCEYNTEKPAQP